MTRKQALLALPAICFAVTGAARFSFAAFSAGDLAVLQATSASGNNTTSSILDLSSTTANQTSPASTAIDGTVFRFSGSATSTGYLSHTADGTLVTFDAANGNTTTGNSNAILPRAAGSIDVNDNVTVQATYTGVSGEQPRSATSLDDSTWYIGDQSGVYTNNSGPTPSPAANLRSVKPFGGTVYTLQQSSTTISISSISAPTAGTITALPGLTADNAAVDFYMVSSGQNGSAYDLLYILDSGNATTDKIDKFSLVGGNWTSDGNVSTGTAIAGFGLAAEETISGNVSLFLTTGNGATPNNSVIALTDTGGYNGNIAINLSNDVTLYTATGNTTLKGIDLAPVAATPEPASLGLLAISGIALLARRRK